ncbi:hypothetical protein GLYMA_19G062900v4 [Glycine max]|uniref:Uncharacterized protein n=1 Tax=Glycine max TaxID=3847 RepID=K7MWX5_SOYBN|nr:hypothetical protein GYH30_052221 [Glycine max]KRG94108.1 hypothetical protein GLYMA_19G062900v4 [Glycine max]
MAVVAEWRNSTFFKKICATPVGLTRPNPTLPECHLQKETPARRTAARRQQRHHHAREHHGSEHMTNGRRRQRQRRLRWQRQKCAHVLGFFFCLTPSFYI